MVHKRAGMGITCLWLFPLTLLGETIRVPSQYPTIQGGLDAAQTGDTVLVASGTYAEHIVWPLRDGIVLMSEHGPDSTVIDGEGAGSAVNFPSSALTRSTVLTGFTVQNGKAAEGAGIHTHGSPHIVTNVVQRNIATASSGSVHGGGILCTGAGAPLIEGNLIRGNVTCGPTWNCGAGVYVDGQNSAVIFGNTIESDSAIGGSWNRGVGIYCDMESSPDICHNIIQGNVAYGGSGGTGGGICAWGDSDAYILSNLICSNILQSDIWNCGAGIFLIRGSVVFNNTIADNRCMGGSIRRGGGICIDDSINTIGNNIMVNNKAAYGGGISAGDHGSAVLLNNDVWNNVGGNYYGITPGSNDISLDPLFVPGPLGGFYLSQIVAGQADDSPCVDHGFASAESLGLHTYTTRTDTVPDSGIADLGYHYPTRGPVSVEERTEDGPKSMPLFEVFPSLSSSSCRVQLALDSPELVEVRIFDASGRLKRALWRGKLVSGKHRWVWDGIDVRGNKVPSGTYFVVVRIGEGPILSEKEVVLR